MSASENYEFKIHFLHIYFFFSNYAHNGVVTLSILLLRNLLENVTDKLHITAATVWFGARREGHQQSVNMLAYGLRGNMSFNSENTHS